MIKIYTIQYLFICLLWKFTPNGIVRFQRIHRIWRQVAFAWLSFVRVLLTWPQKSKLQDWLKRLSVMAYLIANVWFPAVSDGSFSKHNQQKGVKTQATASVIKQLTGFVGTLRGINWTILSSVSSSNAMSFSVFWCYVSRKKSKDREMTFVIFLDAFASPWRFPISCQRWLYFWVSLVSQ